MNKEEHHKIFGEFIKEFYDFKNNYCKDCILIFPKEGNAYLMIKDKNGEYGKLILIKNRKRLKHGKSKRNR